IEYATWVRPREITRTLPALLAMRGAPPVQNADATLLPDVERERALLDLFYGSALAAYRGDRDGWSRDAAELARAGRDNPYFRWFIGGPE
ncbi:MAG: spermidine synthase, partial [Achromobacter piechaudii]